MAKTVKRESKPKTTTTKKNVKEISINENNISSNIEDTDEPVLVNKENEIIYDPQEELKTIMNDIEEKIPTDFIAEDVKEGLNYIKNSITIPTELNSNIEANIDFVEKQIDELSKIKENISKNSTKSNFNFTSFWNGTTNKW